MAIQDLSAGLAEIAKLSNDELKDLCNSESHEKYDEIVNQSDRVKSLEAEREMLMASIRSLAEFNLARQGDYEGDRARLLTLVGDSNKLKEEIQEKATKLLELSRRTSLQSTLSVVLAATGQAEQDSESLAKAFLENSLDHDAFVGQYTDKRKLAHLRRIKADRLRQETDESWTVISWLVPLIGHTGIATSDGAIHDFGGSYYVAVDNMTFGRPTKYVQLEPAKAEALAWDDAIQVSARRFRGRCHNIVTNNCHDHVADSLNEMRYNGRNDYNSFDVFMMVTFQSSYVGPVRGFLSQWGVFIMLLLTFVIVYIMLI